METPTQHLYKQCQAEKEKKTNPNLFYFCSLIQWRDCMALISKCLAK